MIAAYSNYSFITRAKSVFFGIHFSPFVFLHLLKREHRGTELFPGVNSRRDFSSCVFVGAPAVLSAGWVTLELRNGVSNTKSFLLLNISSRKSFPAKLKSQLMLGM